ncbi:MAG: pyruvate dehydrogenase complex dihydrolipoamide acetyltransferase [Balneolaceae bacterium]|nr:MAG: pyruvate dehydrogenase complex dihydrolipoamide acetyltransferase [Balneolaceae bacterium]
MAIKIEMPKLSDTMEEGVIAKWNVKEGDKVSSGDVIAEVETDKATMEVEVFDDGTILKILAGEGDAIPLGGIMAVIGDEGEDISDLLSGANGGGDAPPAQKEKKADKKESADSAKKEEFDPILGDLNGKTGESKAEPASAASDENETGDGRIKVSPLARKMAEDKGINLSDVKGSGPDGRIVKKDIEEFTPASKPAEKSAAVQLFESEEAEEVRISQMRKTIAKRLSESKFTNPHFYETIDIDMEPAMAARAGLNEVSDVKISFNDIIVKAASVALRRHPAVNSSWLGDVIRKHGDVNVAVAVAIDEGLMTPVLRNTDKKNLRQISAETRELASLARDRKLAPEQMEGSTFTISNLGMFGIEEFTAIINPPNACILAVGAIRHVPVVKDGAVVPGHRMKVTLSSDHRVVDGAKAAEFLNTFRQLLENPLSMLL